MDLLRGKGEREGGREGGREGKGRSDGHMVEDFLSMFHKKRIPSLQRTELATDGFKDSTVFVFHVGCADVISM